MPLFGGSGSDQKAQALTESAMQLARHGDVAAAIRLFEQVVDLWKKKGKMANVAKTLQVMGNLLADSGNAERALACWQNGYDLAVQVGETMGQGILLSSMANLKAVTRNFPEAFALGERSFPLLDATGEHDTLASTLWHLAGVADQVGDHARALRYLQKLREVAERMGDHARREMAVRAVGQIHCQLRQFPEALVALQSAHEIRRDRLGDAAGAAITLANIADCHVELGEIPRAQSLLNECLATFEQAGDLENRAMILNRLAQLAFQRGDLARALVLAQRALETFRRLGQRQAEACMLASLAPIFEKQGERARAVETLRQGIALFQALGDVENEAQASRDLAALLESPGPSAGGAAWATGGPGELRVLDRSQILSLSEYDLAPRSAPYFAVGELLAAMHAKGVLNGDLRPGNIVLRGDGAPVIVSARNSKFDQPLEPEPMAANLKAAHLAYVWEDFRAILAGYTRAGYEGLDTLRPGFTDAVLDALGVPNDRPRPCRPPIDGATVLRELRSELVARNNLVVLAPAGPGSPALATGSFPPDCFVWVLVAMAVGIDCGSLFEGERVRPSSEAGARLFRFLRFARGEPGVEYPFGVAAPDGLELAVALGVGLRSQGAESSTRRFEAILPLTRKLLVEGPLDQTSVLGETLTDVALTCSRLSGLELFAPRAWAQQAIVFTQHLARGTRRDELRLSALTRRLYEHRWFPLPFGRHPWPEDEQDLSLARSLTLTYRDLVTSSLTEQSATRPGILWSAGRRGVQLCRAMVRRCHDLAAALPPARAAIILTLVHHVLDAYAATLDCMANAAMREHQNLGGSAWLTFFADQPGEQVSLANEFTWIAEFLATVGKDTLDLDRVRAFVQRGARFLGQSSDGDVLQDRSRLN